MARDLTNLIVASPNQASTVFGVGGAHPIRQKSLFLMRFSRKVGEGGEEWKSGLSFVVKQVDQPSVQPTTEEINQYNRKRIIHTGLKYQPVNCTFYDTADGAAKNMWLQYASYHFGDYRQESANYADDIINSKMFGTQGYGYGISKTSTAEPEGINTQFFFDKIEVFEVWGNEYTAYQLLNPKITAFNPGDLDYENSAAQTIAMSIDYEAVYHENGGKPMRLSTSATLTETFAGSFSGETIDPTPSATRTTSFASTIANPSIPLSTETIAGLLNSDTTVTSPESDRSDTTTSSGGALSKYGNFDFGDFTSLSSNLPTELSTVAGAPRTTREANEQELARITGRTISVDGVQSALGRDTSSIPDIARGINSASILRGNSPSDHVSHLDDDFLAGLQDDADREAQGGAFAQILSLDDDAPRPAPNDAIVGGSKAIVRGGLSLSPLTIASVNTNSDGTSQIGQRSKSSVNPLLAFIVEPKHSSVLTPDLVYGAARNRPVVITATVLANHTRIPIKGTFNRPIRIFGTLKGFGTVSGKVAAPLKITTVVRSVAAISGTIRYPAFGWRTLASGITPVNGMIVGRVTIQSTSVALGNVSGQVDRARIIIRGSANGVVTDRRASVVGVVRPRLNGLGFVAPAASVNKKITITMNCIILQIIFGSVSKPIAFTVNARGISISRRDGTVLGRVVIKSASAGIVKQPNIGSINNRLAITVEASAEHRQPKKGTLNKALPISIAATGQVPLFARVARSINISANIAGYVAPVGSMSRQLRILALASGSSLVYSTLDRQVPIRAMLVGFSQTNISPAHRYWRLKSTSTQTYFGATEMEFRQNLSGPSITTTGTAIASSSYSSTYSPDKAFDRDGATWWSSPMNGGNGWLGYDLGRGMDKQIREVMFASDDPVRVPTSFVLQSSDDGSYWSDLFGGEIPSPAANTIYVLNANGVTAYQGMYRLRALAAPPGGGAASFATIALYNNSGLPIPLMSAYANETASGSPAAAFDADSASVWVSGADGSQALVGAYAASLDMQLGSLTVRAATGAQALTSFVIEYSSDGGSIWAEVFRVEGDPAFADNEQRTYSTNGAGIDIGDGSVLVVNDQGDILGY